MYIPNNAIDIESSTEDSMQTNEYKLPLFCNVTTSKENCENVVIPPSNPVKRNKLKYSLLSSPIETRIPNIKEPNTFTNRVPN